MIHEIAQMGFNTNTGARGLRDVVQALKDVVSNGRGLVYSFSKGLGGNMFGVIATGYFSPVNILVLLFEKSEMFK